jgi:outer membrane protein assembly factor BamD (BamD/ComL family)
MRHNVKITKQDMKHDKFTEFVFRTKDYVVQNWLFVLGGVVAAVIIAAAVIFFTSQASKKQEEAAELFNKAMQSMRSQNYQLAIIDFKNVMESYGSTSYAADAAFNLGNAYFEAKNYAEAQDAFQAYLKEYNGGKFHKVSAVAGIAACLESDGKWLEAAEKYKEAAEMFPESRLAGQYYLAAMRNYARGGDMTHAKDMYVIIDEDFSGTQYQTDSKIVAGEFGISL